MENRESSTGEFLGIMCNLYIVGILAVLPLYTGGTYYQIGDTKYAVFRNIAIFCLTIWAIFSLGEGASKLFRHRREWMKSAVAGLSSVDLAMLAYVLCVLISTWHSSYTKTAWLGYWEWYMGAVSQLLFVGTYFFLSRCYTGQRYPILLGEAAFLAAILLGFANRLGWDPLGLFATYGEEDWAYSHMLSTLGNINWLCGYMGVMIAFPLTGFLSGKDGRRRAAYFVFSALGVTMLVLQGSDVGIVLALVAVGLCLLAGYDPLYKKHFRQYEENGLFLAACVSLLIGVMGQITALRGTIQAMPSDSPLQGILTWYGWWVIALILFLLSWVVKVLPERLCKIAMTSLLGVSALVLAVLGVWYLSRHPFDGNWGSGRGSLWKAALRGFGEAGWVQKLIGAGPDCYAEYIYRIMQRWEVSQIEGHWEGSVFTNAHNEWLTQLVNLGVLGLGAYLAIFVTAFKRYRGMFLGVFALALYGVNSLVSFQQVLNAPVLFVILGLCEYKVRWTGEQRDRHLI
ncbi:MAG: O-antigen ligase family protein [Candidatus Gastranaerophilales bacterium]|nr:O-antigen ligase family protein [Candidatus Gastranaerophilales bacterium]